MRRQVHVTREFCQDLWQMVFPLRSTCASCICNQLCWCCCHAHSASFQFDKERYRAMPDFQFVLTIRPLYKSRACCLLSSTYVHGSVFKLLQCFVSSPESFQNIHLSTLGFWLVGCLYFWSMFWISFRWIARFFWMHHRCFRVLTVLHLCVRFLFFVFFWHLFIHVYTNRIEL